MSEIKSFAIVLFFFLPFFLSSQSQSDNDLLHIEIRKKGIEFKKDINFYKAHLFFLNKNWDSSLVYSMRQLATESNTEVSDYCHYFRGKSLYEKMLLSEAKKEFDVISKNFRFYYKVRLSLGEISLEQRDFTQAIYHFKEVEKKTNSFSNRLEASNVIHNIGLCYLHLNQFDKAEDYLFKSVVLQEKERDTSLLVGSYMDIANLYYLQYKDDEAIPYFEKAYQLSKKTKDFGLKQNAAMNMAAVEENRKNFSASLVYRKEYESWKDSLNNQNKVWALAELEKKFAVMQKQKEVDVLNAQNKLKIAERNGFVFTSITLLIILGIGIYVYRQKVKRNKIILSQKTELDHLNATKDKLFSIVGHDLRSSVNALKDSNKKLLENLETKDVKELGKLLRNNSQIANGTYNLLDNLLNWALLQSKQSYFFMESIRLHFIVEQVEYNYRPLMLDKNIDFVNKIPKNILVYVDQDSLKIVIRNLLDNAIKFSVNNGSIVLFAIDRDSEYYDMIIQDTGQGMDEDTRQELLKETVLLSRKKNEEGIGTGLGLQLCKSMVAKKKGKLYIESQKDIGTKIVISLLKIKKDE